MSDNPDERAALRERAKILGIHHSPNISNQLLKERIAAKLNDEEDPGEGEQPEPVNEENPLDDGQDPEETPSSTMDNVAMEEMASRIAAKAVDKVRDIKSTKPLTKKQLEQAEREKQWKEELRLVRVQITCLNPLKKELKGEVISVSNKFLGTVRKFIPFGEATDNGYHIPKVLLTELQGRQFQSITVKKTNSSSSGGATSLPEHRLVKEFAINILPDLTPDELARLARTQAAAANA